MRTESMIVIAALVVLAWLSVLGIYDIVWSNPHKKAEIRSLQAKTQVWQDRAIQAEAKIEDYKVAMKFENLFLLSADANDMMDFSMLEDMLCEKRGLCK